MECLRRSVLNAIACAATEGGQFDFSFRGDNTQAIESLAAKAGVTLDYSGSDENLIEKLLDALGGDVGALCSLLFGDSAVAVFGDGWNPADVAGMLITAAEGEGKDKFVTSTDIAQLFAQPGIGRVLYEFEIVDGMLDQNHELKWSLSNPSSGRFIELVFSEPGEIARVRVRDGETHQDISIAALNVGYRLALAVDSAGTVSAWTGNENGMTQVSDGGAFDAHCVGVLDGFGYAVMFGAQFSPGSGDHLTTRARVDSSEWASEYGGALDHCEVNSGE